MATPQFYRKFTSVDRVSGEQKNVSCKNINWQWLPRLAHAWDVLWYDIVSVDQIAHGKCDCRTVILAIIFYRSLVSESSVTGLGVYTRRWVYDNITPHWLCYLARVRPVVSATFRRCVDGDDDGRSRWLRSRYCPWRGHHLVDLFSSSVFVSWHQ